MIEGVEALTVIEEGGGDEVLHTMIEERSEEGVMEGEGGG